MILAFITPYIVCYLGYVLNTWAWARLLNQNDFRLIAVLLVLAFVHSLVELIYATGPWKWEDLIPFNLDTLEYSIENFF